MRALLIIILLCLTIASQAQQPPPGATAQETVAYIHIDGIIDRIRHRYLQRAIASADQQNIDTLIVHINTDGGEVYYARQMMKLILDQKSAGRKTIAFVDFRAISAGALIAYGHQELYISPTATIGDIGVILIKPGGDIEYAPEKIETVVRALLAQAAELNGWNRGVLLKMTARNQNLYRINLPDGTSTYVIEDDLPGFLARHPGIDKENGQQVVLFRGQDRLLTLTGGEAVELEAATQLMTDLDSLYQHLGFDRDHVIDLQPTLAEQIASYFATWAPMLAGLALLFIIFELKTPGVGLWALLGGLCGILFLIAQYTLNMIDYLEVILIALGLMLIVVEFLTMAGGFLIGLSGALLVFTGLVMAFLPDEFPFDLSNERFVDALASAALNGIIAIVIMSVGIIAFIAAIPHSRIAKRVAVQSEISATSADQNAAAETLLIGQSGISRKALRPSGVVTIAGRDHAARAAHGVYIEAQQPVTVIAVEFGELIVQKSSAREFFS